MYGLTYCTIVVFRYCTPLVLNGLYSTNKFSKFNFYWAGRFKTPDSAIPSGSFIEDFHFVRLKFVTTRQEGLGEVGSLTVTRWRDVGGSKV